MVEDSAARLKLLGRFVAITIAHFRTVLDRAAFGRTVLLPVLQELQHNKIISNYAWMHKMKPNIGMRCNDVTNILSLGTFAIGQLESRVAGQTITSIRIVCLAEDIHRRTSIRREEVTIETLDTLAGTVIGITILHC